MGTGRRLRPMSSQVRKTLGMVSYEELTPNSDVEKRAPLLIHDQLVGDTEKSMKTNDEKKSSSPPHLKVLLVLMGASAFPVTETLLLQSSMWATTFDFGK